MVLCGQEACGVLKWAPSHSESFLPERRVTKPLLTFPHPTPSATLWAQGLAN